MAPSPDASTRTDDEDDERGATWRRLLIGVVIFGMLLMWGYGLFGPRSEAPGSLSSAEFASTAEPTCTDARAAIDELPRAHETEDPIDRADVIDEANDHLTAMSTELRTQVPTEKTDAAMVTEWLDDWDVLIADRQRFADAIRTDRTARYLETEKAGNHLSEALNRFAEINEMPSCADPGDVG